MRFAVTKAFLCWALAASVAPGATLSGQSSGRTQQPGGTVTGTVIAAGSSRLLADALVTLTPISDAPESESAVNVGGTAQPTARSLITREQGSYLFSGLSAGRYTLLITHEAYIPVEIALEIDLGTDLNLTAALELEPVRMTPLRQDTTAAVTGRVTDLVDGQPLPNVEVTVEGTQIRAVTNADGRYWLVRVPPGPQVLRTRRIGYAPNRVPLSVPPRGRITQDITLAVSALLVEGITVTGDAISRAHGELATATVIEAEAIRHQTAASLRGVLELVPGVEMAPAGLESVEQLALRAIPTSGFAGSRAGYGTVSYDLASFGTLIVLNGVPLSNNANLLQTGAGSALNFSTSAGGGIDLRKIPARTIERIEVIRGVPSARYGDLTQGVIVVDTRADVLEPEVALRVDQRTVEGTLVAGRAFAGGRHSGTVTLDYSRSASSPGRTPDAVHRFAGQIAHRAEIGMAPPGARQPGKWVLDTRIDAYQLTDDRPPHEYSRDWGSWSRDRGLRVSERVSLALSENTELKFTGSLSAIEQKGTAQKTLTRGPMPFSDRLTAGRSEGQFVLGKYLAESTTDSRPILAFAQFEGETTPDLLGARHSLRGGLEFRREWTSGPGYQFDVLNPPQVTFNGVNGFARPRSYESIPPLVTSSIYVDDRATATLGRKMLLTLQAGLRLDLLHDGSHWASAPRDAVLQPRLNLEFSPKTWLRFRGGWGLVSKTPWLAQLYPDPQYYDVINVNWYTPEPEERLAILTTMVEDPTNEDLGFTVAEKAEAGISLGFGRSALEIVFFRDKIRDGVGIRGTPGYVLRDHYDLVDSTRGTGVPPVIVEPAAYNDTVPILRSVPANNMTMVNRGIELTGSLPQIPWLRTRLHVTGQWIETKQSTDALYFGTAYRFGQFALTEYTERTPYWGATIETAERILLTYRVIHHQPEVGLVITATIQHNVLDRLEDVAATDTLAFLGYLTRSGELVPVPESDRALPEYADLHLARGGALIAPQKAPADWMLSLQVSKTFPLGGRLSFWAFNLLDRIGTYGDIDVAYRIYRRMRFGLELTLPIRGVLGWAY